MSDVTAFGLGVDPPAGWEGRIYQRADAEQRAAREAEASSTPPGDPAPPGEQVLPVIHVATIPVPIDAADYGSDIVGDLGRDDAFIVVKEFSSTEIGSALFAREGVPRVLDLADFSPSTLQRSLQGQAGAQIFFHEARRAFCLYVVLGSYDNRATMIPRVNGVLATLAIEPVPG